MTRARRGLRLSLLLIAAGLIAPQAGLATPPASTPSSGNGGVGLGSSASTSASSSSSGSDSGSGSGSGSASGADAGFGTPATGAVALAAVAQPANLTVTASANGITIATVESALVRQTVQFTGTAPAAERGKIVMIERASPQTPTDWIVTAQALVTSDGTFTATWRASQSGLFSVRAAIAQVIAGTQIAPTSSGVQATDSSAQATSSSAQATSSGVQATDSSAQATSSSAQATSSSAQTTSAAGGGGAGLTSATTPPAGAPASGAITMTVYRPAVASYYGPGFFGSKTACGRILRRSTLGVASLTLKCGTPVRIFYDGHTLVAPVIDRGPYAKGISWDLTEATAQALGITGNTTIGTIALG